MVMRIVWRLTLSGLLCAGLLGAVVLGQTPAPERDAKLPPNPTSVYQTTQDVHGRVYYEPVLVPNSPYASHAQTNKLVQDYAKAKDEDEKSNVREKLRTEVGKQFDLTMK